MGSRERIRRPAADTRERETRSAVVVPRRGGGEEEDCPSDARSEVATGGSRPLSLSRSFSLFFAENRRAPRTTFLAGAGAVDALTSRRRDVGVVTDAH